MTWVRGALIVVAGLSLLGACDRLLSLDRPVPRLIAPLSTSTVTSRRPTLRWAMAGVGGRPTVDLCGDRACTRALGHATIDANGERAIPDEDLPPGVVYWRVRSGTFVSPLWELFIGRQSAPVASDHPSSYDGNSDGFSDLAVSYMEKVQAGLLLRTELFRGASSGPDPPPLTIGGGTSLAVVDINGDGFSDLALGRREVASSLFLGRRDGWSAIQEQTGTTYGDLVNASDLNGDGLGDLALCGRRGLLVILGSETPSFENILPVAEGRPCYWAAGGGDFDGDGYGDLVAVFESQSHVFLGGPGLPSGWVRRELPVNSAVFRQPTFPGDLNADGFADVVLPAQGKTLVFQGGPGGPQLAWELVVDAASVAGAGDVNGDGFGDLALGTGQPIAFIYYGSRAGLRAFEVRPPAGADDTFGAAVAGVGDVNGDGYDDLAVGAPGTNLPGAPGVVYVFVGGAGGVNADDPARRYQLLPSDPAAALFGYQFPR